MIRSQRPIHDINITHPAIIFFHLEWLGNINIWFSFHSSLNRLHSFISKKVTIDVDNWVTIPLVKEYFFITEVVACTSIWLFYYAFSFHSLCCWCSSIFTHSSYSFGVSNWQIRQQLITGKNVIKIKSNRLTLINILQVYRLKCGTIDSSILSLLWNITYLTKAYLGCCTVEPP